jgi:hypothetical protein
MELVVGSAVLEVVLQTSAYNESVLLIDGDVTAVKQSMHVRPERKAVWNRMHTAVEVRLDVGGL